MKKNNILIIGAGQAGFQIATSLRQKGFDGGIQMVGNESTLPYQRPPLSKKLITGEITSSNLSFRNSDFFNENRIDLTQNVALGKSTRIPFDKLAITTGTRSKQLDIPGNHLAGIYSLRSIADAENLKLGIEQANDIVIVGGGFIGLEIAATLSKLGKKVTLLEAGPRLMARAVSMITSNFFEEYHTENGVRILTLANVAEIRGKNSVEEIVLSDGKVFSCDLILTSIGAVANIELAQQAGLKCANGIYVNQSCVTSAAHVVSAGDCALHFNRFAGDFIRLESVQNAIDQSKIAAATLMGEQQIYDSTPWFWSDQGSHKLQMTGISGNVDQYVVRGNIVDGKFSVFHLRGQHIIAVDSVNSPADHMKSRKLIHANIEVNPDDLANLNFDLQSLLLSHSRSSTV